MSDRITFVTGRIHCEKCFNAIYEALKETTDHLSVVVPFNGFGVISGYDKCTIPHNIEINLAGTMVCHEINFAMFDDDAEKVYKSVMKPDGYCYSEEIL